MPCVSCVSIAFPCLSLPFTSASCFCVDGSSGLHVYLCISSSTFYHRLRLFSQAFFCSVNLSAVVSSLTSPLTFSSQVIHSGAQRSCCSLCTSIIYPDHRCPVQVMACLPLRKDSTSVVTWRVSSLWPWGLCTPSSILDILSSHARYHLASRLVHAVVVSNVRPTL